MKKVIKKALSVLLAVVIMLTAAPLSGFVGFELPKWLDFSINASAATSGTCGENLIWTFNESTGTLTISGTGAMDNFTSSFYIPWYDIKDKIKETIIKSGVTTIGQYAFWGCSYLKNVYISSSVEKIDEDSFKYCSSLTNITVDQDNLFFTNDEFGVLYNKDKTTLVYYPNGSSMTNYIIPETVQKIYNGAFAGNRYLSSFNVSKNNSYFSVDEHGVLFNYNKTILIQYPKGNTRTNYSIPNSVETISAYSFYACDSFTSIFIPQNVKSIEDKAFINCSKLQWFKVDSRNQFYSTDNFGALFNKDKTVLIQYPIGLTNENYSIPSGTINVNNWAFFSAKNLVNINISNSVIKIGWESFGYCSNLQKVIVGESVKIIEGHAFINCNKLFEVHFTGSEEQWNRISIDSNNICLLNADIHYNSTGSSSTLNNIIITENPIILDSGDYSEQAITAIYKDNVGNSILDADIQWNVGDNSIVEIIEIQNGYGSTVTFKAKKDGATTLIAHYLDKTAICYIFVGEIKPQLTLNVSDIEQNGNSYSFNITVGNFGYSSYTQQQIEEATAENVNVTINLPKGFSFDENDENETTAIISYFSMTPGSSDSTGYTIYKVGEPSSNKMSMIATASNTSECRQTVKIFTDGRELTKENRKEINDSIKVSFEVLDDYRKIQQRGGKIECGYRYANSILESNEIPIKITVYNSIPSKYNEYEEYIKSNSEFDYHINQIEFIETKGCGFKEVSLDSSFEKTIISAGEYATFYGTAVIEDGYLPMQENEKEKLLSSIANVLINDSSYYNSELNITVNNVSYKGSTIVQSTNPSTELRKIPNAECSLVGLMELGLSNEQCTYLSKLVLTELSIYSIPTQSLEEYISEKILKKVFGFKKLLEVGNGEFVITIPLEINGEKIEIDLINTVFGASWNGTGIGNINSISYEAYKIEKGFLGNQKRAKNPYKSGTAGVATIANIEKFFEAVCDYTLDSVKSASKSVLGNVKEVERFLFGNCAMNILNAAGYSSFFDYGWSIYVNECKEVTFECPVDVYVYNQKNEICGTIINNIPTSMNDDIELEVVNDTKIVKMYSSGYYIKTVSTCEGTLNISVTERDYNNGARRIVTYDNLPLDIGTEYIQNYGDGFNVEASTYDVIFEDGSKKTSNNEILLLKNNFYIYNYIFSIQKSSRTEIRHKDGIKLHVNIEGTAPAGSYVVWTADNNKFKTEEINDGNSLKIISNKNGTTTFTATLYSADGDVLATDTIEMKSKAGFFDKIGSFFRSIFGGTKIYEN